MAVQSPDLQKLLDLVARLRAELGDLLVQVAFIARLAEEAGAFSLSQVVDGVHQKMVSRHAGRFQAFFLAHG